MRLGLIARPDSRGLGVQCKSFNNQMHPDKVIVIDCPSAKPLPIRRDWYPDATWVHGLPTHADFRGWLDGLTHVYTAETGYGGALWDEAERAGVKTVLHANYEFLNRNDRPTLWAAPSMWHFDDFPAPKLHLPVPVELDRYEASADSDTCARFLHLIGRPALVPDGRGGAWERSGTVDLLQALQYVTADVTVTFRSQEPGYVCSLIHQHRIHTKPNVTLVVEEGDVQDNADLYRDQDVLVLPRRWGGLSLPTNEAIGAGMPCIMPNTSPQTGWLPDTWLVPATATGTFTWQSNRIDVYSTDICALAETINLFASDAGFYTKAKQEAAELREAMSWTSLKPMYQKVLNGL